MKKVFSLSDREFKEHIKKSCINILRENPQILLEMIDFGLHKQSLNEMAKMNNKDPMNSPFPPDKFDIILWSNDHNPPHFHLKGPEEWELIFSIESGKLLKVKHIGKNSKYYRYMVDNVPIWLSMLSYPRRKITNKEELEDLWHRMHL